MLKFFIKINLFYFLFILIFSSQLSAQTNDIRYLCYRSTHELIEEVKQIPKEKIIDYDGNYSALLTMKNDQEIIFTKFSNIYIPIKATFLKSKYLDLTGLKSREGKKIGPSHLYDYYKSTKKSHLFLNGKVQKDNKEDVYFQIDLRVENINPKEDIYLALAVFKSPDHMSFQPIKDSNINSKIYPSKKNYSIHDVMNYPPTFFSKKEIQKRLENYQCKLLS